MERLFERMTIALPEPLHVLNFPVFYKPDIELKSLISLLDKSDLDTNDKIGANSCSQPTSSSSDSSSLADENDLLL